MRISVFTLLSLALFRSAIPAHAQAAEPDPILQGKIASAQNKTWQGVPFEVPAGVHRISVDFSYTGKEDKTALDLGIADPYRFRGYSGGNKSHFTIGEADATPSYLPGAIPAGTWKLLISVPNIRSSQTSEYRAEIRFNSELEDQGFMLAPLETDCAGIAAICTCTPRTATGVAKASPAGPCHVRCLSPRRLPRRMGSISSPSPITTPSRNTTTCVSCSRTSIGSC